jgi:CRP/FNR family transcriptional regulator, anaerobic regulatory protein
LKDFRKIIQDYFGTFTEEELQTVLSYFYEEKIIKNDFFIESNKKCDKLSIIKSGILRIYTLVDGKEITQWIATENYFITDVSSFFFENPNRWTIQALTEVELLTIKKVDYQKLCKEFPKWNEIEKKFIAKCFTTLEDRVFSHLSMSAQNRYTFYFNQNKELFNQVPLQYIASVLGMTAETFSRIRKKQLANS